MILFLCENEIVKEKTKKYGKIKSVNYNELDLVREEIYFSDFEACLIDAAIPNVKDIVNLLKKRKIQYVVYYNDYSVVDTFFANFAKQKTKEKTEKVVETEKEQKEFVPELPEKTKKEVIIKEKTKVIAEQVFCGRQIKIGVLNLSYPP